MIRKGLGAVDEMSRYSSPCVEKFIVLAKGIGRG